MSIPKGHNKQVAAVKSVYIDLIKPTELGKCLHGKTPKIKARFLIPPCGNESQRTSCCAFDKLELALCDAVANFNDGKQASTDILKRLNISLGYHTATMCFEVNKQRQYLTTYNANDTTKKYEILSEQNEKEMVAAKKNWKARSIGAFELSHM